MKKIKINYILFSIIIFFIFTIINVNAFSVADRRQEGYIMVNKLNINLIIEEDKDVIIEEIWETNGIDNFNRSISVSDGSAINQLEIISIEVDGKILNKTEYEVKETSSLNNIIYCNQYGEEFKIKYQLNKIITKEFLKGAFIFNCLDKNFVGEIKSIYINVDTPNNYRFHISDGESKSESIFDSKNYEYDKNSIQAYYVGGETYFKIEIDGMAFSSSKNDIKIEFIKCLNFLIFVVLVIFVVFIFVNLVKLYNKTINRKKIEKEQLLEKKYIQDQNNEKYNKYWGHQETLDLEEIEKLMDQNNNYKEYYEKLIEERIYFEKIKEQEVNQKLREIEETIDERILNEEEVDKIVDKIVDKYND